MEWHKSRLCNLSRITVLIDDQGNPHFHLVPYCSTFAQTSVKQKHRPKFPVSTDTLLPLVHAHVGRLSLHPPPIINVKSILRLRDDIPRMNNTRYPTQEIERNVDEQISAAAALDEDGHGREEEG